MRRGLCIAVAAGGLLVPASASAATIGVDTTADQFNTDPGHCALREAIQAAGTDAAFGGCPTGQAAVQDVVAVPAGTYGLARAGAGEDLNATGDFDLDTSAGPVAIERSAAGSRPTIDAAFLDRALDVHGSGALELTGVRLIDGDAKSAMGTSQPGGALRWSEPGQPGDLTVSDAVFEGSFASLGGAIEADTTGAHTVEDSSLHGNFAADRGAIHSFGTLTVSGSSVSGNGGGGIAAEGVGAGALGLSASTVAGNTIGADNSIGGVFAEGDAEIVNSTIAGNIGGFIGGVTAHSALTVRFSTIAGNGSPNAGGSATGGIDVQGTGAATLDGVIVSRNVTGTAASNCNGPIDADLAPSLESANTCGLQAGGPDPSLVNADPMLDPLASNGGPTQTQGLYPGSPAIDAAGDCSPLAQDQRGQPRPLGGGCDIGAFEGSVPRPPPTPPATTPQQPSKAKRKCKAAKSALSAGSKAKRCKRKRRKRRAALAASDTEVIGRSAEGRPIRAVQIGNPEAERVALVVGVIHGDERAGLRITRELLRRGRGIDHAQVWVIDSVNPDGAHAHSRGNAHAVDLNRNFPHRWRGGVPRSSGYYPGPNAASEPETRAVMSFVDRIQPDLSVWYHQPWGAVLACKGRPQTGARYAKLVAMGTSCRGKGLAGTAIGWENATMPGTSAFVVELPAGRIGERATRRHARAAAELAEPG